MSNLESGFPQKDFDSERLKRMKTSVGYLKASIETNPRPRDVKKLAELKQKIEKELGSEDPTLVHPEMHSENTMEFPKDPAVTRLLTMKLETYKNRRTSIKLQTPESVLMNEYSIIILECLLKYKSFDLDNLPKDVEKDADNRLPFDKNIFKKAFRKIKRYAEEKEVGPVGEQIAA